MGGEHSKARFKQPDFRPLTSKKKESLSAKKAITSQMLFFVFFCSRYFIHGDQTRDFMIHILTRPSPTVPCGRGVPAAFSSKMGRRGAVGNLAALLRSGVKNGPRDPPLGAPLTSSCSEIRTWVSSRGSRTGGERKNRRFKHAGVDYFRGVTQKINIFSLRNIIPGTPRWAEKNQGVGGVPYLPEIRGEVYPESTPSSYTTTTLGLHWFELMR